MRPQGAVLRLLGPFALAGPLRWVREEFTHPRPRRVFRVGVNAAGVFRTCHNAEDARELELVVLLTFQKRGPGLHLEWASPLLRGCWDEVEESAAYVGMPPDWLLYENRTAWPTMWAAGDEILRR